MQCDLSLNGHTIDRHSSQFCAGGNHSGNTNMEDSCDDAGSQRRDGEESDLLSLGGILKALTPRPHTHTHTHLLTEVAAIAPQKNL